MPGLDLGLARSWIWHPRYAGERAPAPRSSPRGCYAGRVIVHEPERPDDAVASDLAAALRELSGPELSSAYLFGSHAVGRPHRESDVDVGVLLSWSLDRPARFAERVRLAGLLPARVGGRDVDVVVLNDAPPHFARHVVMDGVRIVCSGLDADHAFRRDVQLRAADLEPFLRRTRRVKLEALAR
jgi:predicted nucleotidyltransferase